MSVARLAAARRARRDPRSSRRASSAPTSPSVFGGGAAPGDRVFAPVERSIYRICGVDPTREQRWTIYALVAARVQPRRRCSSSTLLQRLQGVPAAQPDRRGGGAAGARVQHRRQLRDQHELAELRRRVDDEPPHPDGRAHGAELRVGRRRARGRGRAHPRPRPPPLDDDRQLLGRPDARHDPRSCCRSRSSSRSSSSSQGVIQNLHGFTQAHDRSQGATQSIPGGPVASQEAIKELGHERRRLLQRQLRAPVREPERASRTFFEIFAAPDHPVRAHLHVRAAGQGPAPGLGPVRRHVRDLARRRPASRSHFETDGNPKLDSATRRPVSGRQHGGQGGALRHRRRPASSPPSTTGTSTGSVNSSHDSFTPARRRRAARPHDARRGQPRRRRRRPLRHARLRPARGVHRRPDGRANAGVPRQEDPGHRDEARRRSTSS